MKQWVGFFDETSRGYPPGVTDPHGGNHLGLDGELDWELTQSLWHKGVGALEGVLEAYYDEE